jgi:hypothetical protein
VVDLEKKIVDWERKLELAEMEFKRVHNTHTNINTSR